MKIGIRLYYSNGNGTSYNSVMKSPFSPFFTETLKVPTATGLDHGTMVVELEGSLRCIEDSGDGDSAFRFLESVSLFTTSCCTVSSTDTSAVDSKGSP